MMKLVNSCVIGMLKKVLMSEAKVDTWLNEAKKEKDHSQ